MKVFFVGITISLPGAESQDSERRRQIALRALSERLSKVSLVQKTRTTECAASALRTVVKGNASLERGQQISLRALPERLSKVKLVQN
jgi:hypothetical protein